LPLKKSDAKRERKEPPKKKKIKNSGYGKFSEGEKK